MEHAKHFLEAKTETEKYEWWLDKINKFRERIKILSQFLNSEQMRMLKSEIEGGICSKCNAPWVEVHFDNNFGKGKYFEPGCNHYPKCRICGRYIFDEALIGNILCPNCDMPFTGFSINALTENMTQKEKARTIWVINKSLKKKEKEACREYCPRCGKDLFNEKNTKSKGCYRCSYDFDTTTSKGVV